MTVSLRSPLSGVKPWMRWMLAGSAALSAIALLLPAGDEQGAVVQARLSDDAGQAMSAGSPESKAYPELSSQALQLPAELPRQPLEPALADLFQGLQPPAPKVVPVQAAAPAPVQIQTPTLNYRFLGRFLGPSGEPMVYLSRLGDGKDVSIAVGTQLDEGFVVEAIHAEAIVLVYPPAGTRLNLAVPSAESQPSR